MYAGVCLFPHSHSRSPASVCSPTPPNLLLCLVNFMQYGVYLCMPVCVFSLTLTRDPRPLCVPPHPKPSSLFSELHAIWCVSMYVGVCLFPHSHPRSPPSVCSPTPPNILLCLVNVMQYGVYPCMPVCVFSLTLTRDSRPLCVPPHPKPSSLFSELHAIWCVSMYAGVCLFPHSHP